MAAADQDPAGVARLETPFVLGARLDAFEDRPPVLRLESTGRAHDPLEPYVTARRIDYPAPGGPVCDSATVVLPHSEIAHTYGAVLRFEHANDVDTLMELLTQVRARLAETVAGSL
jgi:hypothetical protein